MEEFKDIPELWDFIKGIEWQDPLILGLLAFHIVITLTTLLTRNYGNFQVLLFFSLILLLFFSENINVIAANHWRYLSKEQYFDSKGMFISIMFSSPILINCMIMVASWLYQSSQLMIDLRRAQLKKIKREISQENSLNNLNKNKNKDE